MRATEMNMTKRMVALVSAALLAATMGLAGCSSGEEEASSNSSAANFSTESQIEQVGIPVKVTTHDGESKVLYDETVTIGEGSTALDVLQATGLELDAQTGDYGMFVNAVDGVANEGMKGWTYTVNGEQVQVSADQAYLNDGDVVEWSYIDMGA